MSVAVVVECLRQGCTVAEKVRMLVTRTALPGESPIPETRAKAGEVLGCDP